MDHDSLADIPLFEGMSDEELQDCAGRFERTEVLTGHELTTEDDFGYSFFVVLEGRVRVQVDQDSADQDSAIELGKGEHFGEMALVTGKKRNATVKALERCQLAKMMTWDFQQLRENNSTFESRIQAAVADRS